MYAHSSSDGVGVQVRAVDVCCGGLCRHGGVLMGVRVCSSKGYGRGEACDCKRKKRMRG